ncbi:MAG TPA: helix-turn-helix domain-containing protein [Steroidobacteraceae bacterium]
MTRTVFDDFDEFADAIKGAAGRFVPTALSREPWWIESATLGRIELQQFQIGGAAAYAGIGAPDTLTIGIPLSDPRRIRVDGHALEHNSLIYLKPDQPFTTAAREPTRWLAISLPLHANGSSASLFDGEQVLASLEPGTRAQTRPETLDRLRELAVRIGTGEFLDPAAAASAEKEAIAAVLSAIEASSATLDRHIGRPQVPRTRVISRALALMESKKGKPLFIDELCRATDVSERTLRNVFQEYFGVGPIRMLKVRQLLEIRAALLEADPGHDTVARTAARFGVWDFSLFARNYKALYGESPSETLRKAQRKSADAGPRWITYAARIFRMPETAPSELLPRPELRATSLLE